MIAFTVQHYQTRPIHLHRGFTLCARKMQKFKHPSIFFDISRVRSWQGTFSISIRFNIGFLGGRLRAILLFLHFIPSYLLPLSFINLLLNFSHNRGLVPPLPISQRSTGNQSLFQQIYNSKVLISPCSSVLCSFFVLCLRQTKIISTYVLCFSFCQ